MKSSFSILSLLLIPEALAVVLPKANSELRVRAPQMPGTGLVGNKAPTTTSPDPTYCTPACPTGYDGGSYSANGAVNLTVTIPVGAMMTDAPVKNATATVYATPTRTESCTPDITPDFPLPEGAVASQGVIRGNCPSASPVPVQKVEIEGHMRGGKEIVDIEISPLGGAKKINGEAMKNSTAEMPM